METTLICNLAVFHIKPLLAEKLLTLYAVSKSDANLFDFLW